MSIEWKKCRKKPIIIEYRDAVPGEVIITIEGTRITMTKEQLVMRGVHGELYPITRAIFHETHEPVSDAPSNAPSGLNTQPLTRHSQEVAARPVQSGSGDGKGAPRTFICASPSYTSRPCELVVFGNTHADPSFCPVADNWVVDWKKSAPPNAPHFQMRDAGLDQHPQPRLEGDLKTSTKAHGMWDGKGAALREKAMCENCHYFTGTQCWYKTSINEFEYRENRQPDDSCGRWTPSGGEQQ